MQNHPDEQQIDYTKIYSSSKLKMFLQCPRQYYFSYIDPIYKKMKYKLQGMPQYIWHFQTVGKAVHNAITLFYYLDPSERTQDNLLLQLRMTWKSEAMWNKKMPLGKWGGFKTIEEERQMYSDALAMLKNFYQLAQKDPEILFLPTNDFKNSIDDYKKLISPLNDQYDISGKFDLIIRDTTGKIHIIDFKTSKSEDIDAFQLNFYKVLAEAKFGEEIYNASFYFLRKGTKSDFTYDTITTTEIKEQILQRINAIQETKTFNPHPTKLCKYCIFKNYCPAREEVQKFTTTSDDDYPDDLPF